MSTAVQPPAFGRIEESGIAPMRADGRCCTGAACLPWVRETNRRHTPAVASNLPARNSSSGQRAAARSVKPALIHGTDFYFTICKALACRRGRLPTGLWPTSLYGREVECRLGRLMPGESMFQAGRLSPSSIQFGRRLRTPAVSGRPGMVQIVSSSRAEASKLSNSKGTHAPIKSGDRKTWRHDISCVACVRNRRKAGHSLQSIFELLITFNGVERWSDGWATQSAFLRICAELEAAAEATNSDRAGARRAGTTPLRRADSARERNG